MFSSIQAWGRRQQEAAHAWNIYIYIYIHTNTVAYSSSDIWQGLALSACYDDEEADHTEVETLERGAQPAESSRQRRLSSPSQQPETEETNTF